MWYKIAQVSYFVLFTRLLALTHLRRMEFPSIINWTSPFPFKGLLGGLFIVIQILIVHSVSKQWRHMRRLIRVSTVCLCPKKRWVKTDRRWVDPESFNINERVEYGSPSKSKWTLPSLEKQLDPLPREAIGPIPPSRNNCA